MKVTTQRIIHPPVAFFHLIAKGASHANIFSLYTKKRIPKVKAARDARTVMTFCRRDIFVKVERTLR